MKSCRLKLLLTVAMFLFLSGQASAAGLWLYEMGIPDNSMAADDRMASSNLMKMISPSALT